MTDPLTGLTNRRAFIAMLQHLVDERIEGCLALFAIDHLKAINMKYGQAMGDEVLVAFSDVLRSLVRSQDTISRIGGESLAVLLPQAAPKQAQAVCQRVIATLSEIRKKAGSSGFTTTASAGVARIGESLDDTLKRAEMALFFAKATGRNRLEMASEPFSWRTREARAS
jgi:diguanylate cyclase (GGDEF)-like protein